MNAKEIAEFLRDAIECSRKQMEVWLDFVEKYGEKSVYGENCWMFFDLLGKEGVLISDEELGYLVRVAIEFTKQMNKFSNFAKYSPDALKEIVFNLKELENQLERWFEHGRFDGEVSIR